MGVDVISDDSRHTACGHTKKDDMVDIFLTIGPVKPIETFGKVKPLSATAAGLLKQEIVKIDSALGSRLEIAEIIPNMPSYSDIVRGFVTVGEKYARLVVFNIEQDKIVETGRDVAKAFVESWKKAGGEVPK